MDDRPPLRNASDRLILRYSDRISGPSGLLILLNGTQSAARIIEESSCSRWNVFTMEHFFLHALVDRLASDDRERDVEIELYCQPDLPDAEFDTIVMPTNSRSAAELTRDVLQDAAERLKPNGRLIVSTDNPKDSWLRDELKAFCGRVTMERESDGVCYIARKKAAPAKRKNFTANFAFRDGERLIQCVTRPGVFCHRRIDAGARALIKSLNLLPDDFEPERVVELGCGGGTVSVAAALRYPESRLLAVDSHARAIQCTEQTATANGVENLTVMLSANGVLPDEGQWDLFLANPPYYSDYRISEVFLQSALTALRPGGRLHLVTRLTDWHAERMTELFGDIEHHAIGGYDVLVSVKK